MNMELITKESDFDTQTKYAVTLRKTRKPMDIDEYSDYIDWLEHEYGVVEDLNFEHTRGLHAHFTLITTTKKLLDKYDILRDRFGWNVVIKPIFYRPGWKRYCEKDKVLTPPLRVAPLSQDLSSDEEDIDEEKQEIIQQLSEDAREAFIEGTKETSQEDSESEH